MENSLVKIESGNLVVSLEVSQRIADFKKKAIEIDLIEKQLKEDILILMEQTGKTTYEDDNLTIVYKKGSSRDTLDSKKLKEEMPDIYSSYVRTSEVRPSVSISVK